MTVINFGPLASTSITPKTIHQEETWVVTLTYSYVAGEDDTIKFTAFISGGTGISRMPGVKIGETSEDLPATLVSIPKTTTVNIIVPASSGIIVVGNDTFDLTVQTDDAENTKAVLREVLITTGYPSSGLDMLGNIGELINMMVMMMVMSMMMEMMGGLGGSNRGNSSASGGGSGGGGTIIIEPGAYYGGPQQQQLPQPQQPQQRKQSKPVTEAVVKGVKTAAKYTGQAIKKITEYYAKEEEE